MTRNNPPRRPFNGATPLPFWLETRPANDAPQNAAWRRFGEDTQSLVEAEERARDLLERRERTEAELGRLRPVVEEFTAASHDLDWEYFRRLQLDGVLPALPSVTPDAAHHRYADLRVGQVNDCDHKNDVVEEGEDDGRDEHDFEVGSKG